jgi:hypothetical protein
MAVFLLTMNIRGKFLEIVIWVVAPIVTGTGFALGVAVFDRLAGVRDSRSLSILLWPVAGCCLGAGTAYWFGPMLIVFGMFLIGTVSVIVLEMIRFSSGPGCGRTAD